MLKKKTMSERRVVVSKLIPILVSVIMLFFIQGNIFAEEIPQEGVLVDILKFVEEGKQREAPNFGLAEYRKLQERHKMVLLVSIAVTTVFFLLLVLLFMTRNGNCTPVNIVNGGGLVLVVQAILFVVVASPTTEQLTFAIGGLAAIGGYLFGRATSRPAH